MRILVIFLLLFLAACTGSQGHFAGAEVTRVSLGGSLFEVRLRGNLAEAIRINPQYAPRLGSLRALAKQVMEAVSGCEVTGVLGDQALMIGVLDCPSAGA